MLYKRGRAAGLWQVVKLNEESAVRYRYSIGQISFGPEIVAIKIYELSSARAVCARRGCGVHRDSSHARAISPRDKKLLGRSAKSGTLLFLTQFGGVAGESATGEGAGGRGTREFLCPSATNADSQMTVDKPSLPPTKLYNVCMYIIFRKFPSRG